MILKQHRYLYPSNPTSAFIFQHGTIFRFWNRVTSLFYDVRQRLAYSLVFFISTFLMNSSNWKKWKYHTLLWRIVIILFTIRVAGYENVGALIARYHQWFNKRYMYKKSILALDKKRSVNIVLNTFNSFLHRSPSPSYRHRFSHQIRVVARNNHILLEKCITIAIKQKLAGLASSILMINTYTSSQLLCAFMWYTLVGSKWTSWDD